MLDDTTLRHCRTQFARFLRSAPDGLPYHWGPPQTSGDIRYRYLWAGGQQYVVFAIAVPRLSLVAQTFTADQGLDALAEFAARAHARRAAPPRLGGTYAISFGGTWQTPGIWELATEDLLDYIVATRGASEAPRHVIHADEHGECTVVKTHGGSPELNVIASFGDGIPLRSVQIFRDLVEPVMRRVSRQLRFEPAPKIVLLYDKWDSLSCRHDAGRAGLALLRHRLHTIFRVHAMHRREDSSYALASRKRKWVHRCDYGW